MPPADLVFSIFPAEVYDPSLKHIWKVAQPHIDVFDNDPELVYGLQAGADLM
jgi:hypothetical protein